MTVTFGAFLSDKLGGASKVVSWANILTALILVGLLVLPTKTFKIILLLIAIVLLCGFFNSGAYGAMFALNTEGQVPARLYATAVGVSSGLGYIPDIFEHMLFGMWIDKYGNAAYTGIFCFGIGLAAMSVLALVYFCVQIKKGSFVFGKAAN